MRLSQFHNDLIAHAALLVPLIWAGLSDPWFTPRQILCLLIVLGWQALFARLRGQGMDWHALVMAGLVAVLVPASAPFWQLVIGLSFGLVLGEAVFGGRGRGFVQPVLLALCFMAFSFPDHPWRIGPDLPVWTAVPMLVALVVTGQARLPVVLGAVLGMAVVGPDALAAGLVSGAAVLVLACLVADPVVAGATPLSRLIYGLLAGGLAALFATAQPLFGALLFATLLVQIFAPLIDHLAIAAHVAWMRRRAARLRKVGEVRP